MKHNYYSSALFAALCICSFAACSDDNTGTDDTQNGPEAN